MDYLMMLNRKLDFIQFFYKTAVQPFLSALDAIEGGRPPYENGLESDGEPPFAAEWAEFNDGRLALGNVTVSMITIVLQEFLAVSADSMGLGAPPKLPQKSWLERYQVLIDQTLGTDILTLTNEPKVIEELILARNITQHAGDIGTNWVYQDKEYAKRYPKGEFINRSIAALLQDDEPNPIQAPLEVNLEKVHRAIESVRDFCASMDAAFQKHPQYWN